MLGVELFYISVNAGMFFVTGITIKQAFRRRWHVSCYLHIVSKILGI